MADSPRQRDKSAQLVRKCWPPQVAATGGRAPATRSAPAHRVVRGEERRSACGRGVRPGSQASAWRRSIWPSATDQSAVRRMPSLSITFGAWPRKLVSGPDSQGPCVNAKTTDSVSTCWHPIRVLARVAPWRQSGGDQDDVDRSGRANRQADNSASPRCCRCQRARSLAAGAGASAERT